MQDIDEIYSKYGNIVYKYVFCLTGNEDTTEEIVQETFFTAVKNINKFRGECKISTWLCQISKYIWYRKIKKECDIVKDLLFSYNDGVLSTTSKEFVENHLKTCEDCNNTLKEIKQESDKKNKSKMQHEKDNIDFFKSVKKKMTKKNIIISIGILILLVIIIFNVLIFYNYNKVASSMIIYLQDDITEEQLENIKNKIIENSSNLELTYISKEKALEEAKDWEDREIVNFLDEYTSGDSNNPFLASIEVKVNSSKEVQELSKIVQNMPGVSSIYSYIEWNPYEFFIASVLQNK